MVIPPGLFQPRRMAGFDDVDDAEEQRLLGRALALLRAEAGLSQEAAGEAFGASGQNWQKYEAGKAPSIFRPAVQRRLAGALGATVHDLRQALQRVLAADQAFQPPPSRGPQGVAEPAGPDLYAPGAGEDLSRRKLAALCASRALTLQMPDDLLRPWASSGATIVYEPMAWPRQEEGCVVETSDGRRQVKIFVRADAETIHLRELHPRPRELAFPREAGVKLHRVTARID